MLCGESKYSKFLNLPIVLGLEKSNKKGVRLWVHMCAKFILDTYAFYCLGVHPSFSETV